MSVQKKSLKSKPAKTQKPGTAKKIQGKPLVSTKAVNLKTTAYPVDPC
jgi:hypothetical protein